MDYLCAFEMEVSTTQILSYPFSVRFFYHAYHDIEQFKPIQIYWIKLDEIRRDKKGTFQQWRVPLFVMKKKKYDEETVWLEKRLNELQSRY